ncbi:hypothetical protein KF840_22445 [bacterium]|nr:hypothetical protein [bacterium]
MATRTTRKPGATPPAKESRQDPFRAVILDEVRRRLMAESTWNRDGTPRQRDAETYRATAQRRRVTAVALCAVIAAEAAIERARRPGESDTDVRERQKELDRTYRAAWKRLHATGGHPDWSGDMMHGLLTMTADDQSERAIIDRWLGEQALYIVGDAEARRKVVADRTKIRTQNSAAGRAGKGKPKQPHTVLFRRVWAATQPQTWKGFLKVLGDPDTVEDALALMDGNLLPLATEVDVDREARTITVEYTEAARGGARRVILQFASVRKALKVAQK